MKRIRVARKGQSIVELAVLMPFFLLVIIGGLIDFGFAFYNLVSLQQIADETAQWAAESNADKGRLSLEVQAYAQNKKPEWWTGVFTVRVPEREKSADGAEFVKVVMTYESPTYTPFYQIMIKSLTGGQNIRLAVQAAYQVPRFVYTRKGVSQ